MTALCDAYIFDWPGAGVLRISAYPPPRLFLPPTTVCSNATSVKLSRSPVCHTEVSSSSPARTGDVKPGPGVAAGANVKSGHLYTM